MKRFEIIALCERWGVPREDWRPFVALIQHGRMAKRLGRRMFAYRPILNEVYAILNRRA